MIQTVNKRMVFFLITTVVLSMGLKTEAQSQALMSLEQCRELALEHNKQIQMA